MSDHPKKTDYRPNPKTRPNTKRSPSRARVAPKAKGNSSKYQARYADEARALCRTGAGTQGLARYFEVDHQTIHNWMKRHPDFRAACEEREVADRNVVSAMYKRAMGGEYEDVEYRYEEVIDAETNEKTRVAVPHKRTVRDEPPHPSACIFWLKNRQPEQWRDRVDVELNDPTSMVAMLNAGRDRVARAKNGSGENNDEGSEEA